MKVLHISNVTQSSGWSKQAEMHLLALDSAGVDVTARNINILNNINPDLNPRIKELLLKDCRNPDCVILNTLPSMYEKTSRAKTFGYYVVETSNFRASGWANKINMLDHAFVPCFHNKQASVDSGVKIPISIVPEALDTSIFLKDYAPHAVRANFPNDFIFYTIGEFTTRKNIEAIAKAFHTEFSPAEPVQLVIKTTPVGMSNPSQEINDRLNAIKRGLKIYNNVERYKRENVICGFASANEIYSLHQSADCYVTASRGEAFNIPLAEAFGFGKTIVSPDHSGMDFVNDKNAFVVSSHTQPCFNALDTLPDLYGAAENWYEVDINSLREQMRAAFEKRSLATKKQQQAKRDIQAYSLENVGQMYRKILEKLL